MRPSSVIRLIGFLIPFLAFGNSNAQDLTTPLGAGNGRPIEGGTGANQAQSPALSQLRPRVKVHQDVAGNACVTVAAHSLPKADFRKLFGGGQTSDGTDIKLKTFEHIISAHNHCGLTVRLRVCYYGSQNCVPLDVPGHDDGQVSLGISPESGFHYQYTEQF
jgi:hypothetical protein